MCEADLAITGYRLRINSLNRTEFAAIYTSFQRCSKPGVDVVIRNSACIPGLHHIYVNIFLIQLIGDHIFVIGKVGYTSLIDYGIVLGC